MDSVISAIEATNLPFEVVVCDPALADTAAFCDAYGFAPDDSCLLYTSDAADE